MPPRSYLSPVEVTPLQYHPGTLDMANVHRLDESQAQPELQDGHSSAHSSLPAPGQGRCFQVLISVVSTVRLCALCGMHPETAWWLLMIEKEPVKSTCH